MKFTKWRVTRTMAPEQAQQFIAKEADQWSKVIAQAGIRAQ